MNTFDHLQPSNPQCESDTIRNSQSEILNKEAAPQPTSPSVIPSPQHSTINPQPTFPRTASETPRAYSAFMTFFQLGHARTLQAVADTLGDSIDTVRRWSSKFKWTDRIQSYNAGLLQQHADIAATSHREQAAQRAARMAELQESQWTAVQKVLSAVHCYLEDVGEKQMEKMTIPQVARTLTLTATVGRQAIAADPIEQKTEPEKSRVEIELAQSLKRVMGNSSSPGSDTNHSLSHSS